jgi:hypothetical protein
VHFPFLVPERVREFLSKLHESPVRKYTFTRPPVPLPVVVAQSYAEVKGLLESREVFDSGVLRRLSDVVRGAELDIRLVSSWRIMLGIGSKADLLKHTGERSTYESRVDATVQGQHRKDCGGLDQVQVNVWERSR